MKVARFDKTTISW